MNPITEALEQNNTTAGKLAAMTGVAERQAARIAALEKALDYATSVLLANTKAEIEAEQKELSNASN